MTNRKFKLVKKYPYSPVIGTIAIYANGHWRQNCSEGNLLPRDIENYPEFWKEVFQVADGEIIKDDFVWVIDKANQHVWHVNYSECKQYSSDRIFIHKENAEKKVEELQSKGLEYYEDKVNYNLGILYNLRIKQFKELFPKYYWLMVLQEIANDLNGDWKPDWTLWSANKYEIVYNGQNEQYSAMENSLTRRSSIYFKSQDLAEKAIEIMGDKLKHIFEWNQ